MIRIIDRYLVEEFIKLFLLIIMALTIVMISSYLFQLTDFIIIKHISPKLVAKLLLYKLPSVMVQSIAMAVLFSIILVMSRLVKDSEFTALRMAGINLWRLVIPLLLLAFLISGVNYMMNEKVVPWTNKNYRDIIDYSIYQKKDPNIHQNILFKDTNERYFYIAKINDKNKELHQIIIYDKSKEINRMITALKGDFRDDSLYLKDGLIYKLDKAGYSQKEAKFKKLKFEIDRDLKEFYKQEKRITEMNRRELKERIDLFKLSGIDVNKLLVEYHFKLAESLVPVIFILIGIPLSLKAKKGRIFGIIASVVIIFIYYVILSISRSLGRNALITPILAAWLPNLVFGLIGSFLILKEDFLCSFYLDAK